MKKIVLLFVEIGILVGLLTGCFRVNGTLHKIGPDGSEIFETQSGKGETEITSVLGFIRYLDGYFHADPETSLFPKQYLFNKDFSFTMTYSRFDAFTELDLGSRQMAEETDSLPYGVSFGHVGGKYYQKYVNTVYGGESGGLFFRETQTHEMLRERDSMSSAVSITSKRTWFEKYGEFGDETEEAAENKVYRYTDLDEWDTDTLYSFNGPVMGYAIESLFSTPFQSDFYVDYSDIRDFSLSYIFEKALFNREGDTVLFNIAYQTDTASVEMSGTVNVETGELFSTVRVSYDDPELALREICYSVEIKTEKVTVPAFDITQDFEESIDAKYR